MTVTSSSSSSAAEILREVFGSAEYGVLFRLWDGTEVPVGREVCLLTVTFSSPAAFLRVFRNPTMNGFAEAYCDGELEMEGDLIHAMRAADVFEEIRLPLLRRLALALKLREVAG
ncbi:MAG: hypothetical protein AABZ64_07670 [Nitrospinota bacterium]